MQRPRYQFFRNPNSHDGLGPLDLLIIVIIGLGLGCLGTICLSLIALTFLVRIAFA